LEIVHQSRSAPAGGNRQTPLSCDASPKSTYDTDGSLAVDAVDPLALGVFDPVVVSYGEDLLPHLVQGGGAAAAEYLSFLTAFPAGVAGPCAGSSPLRGSSRPGTAKALEHDASSRRRGAYQSPVPGYLETLRPGSRGRGVGRFEDEAGRVLVDMDGVVDPGGAGRPRQSSGRILWPSAARDRERRGARVDGRHRGGRVRADRGDGGGRSTRSPLSLAGRTSRRCASMGSASRVWPVTSSLRR
jgi:hypothetical protein